MSTGLLPALVKQPGRMVPEKGTDRNLLSGRCAVQLVNASITGACTELVCFRLQEPDGLRCVAKLGADRLLVEKLPPGAFISYNRLSGASLTGRVF